MNGSLKKTLVNALIVSAGAGLLFIILLLHNAWGDNRYQRTEKAVLSQISSIDMQLSVIGIEILFAETNQDKEKFEAMKAIFDRKKVALQQELQSAED